MSGRYQLPDPKCRHARRGIVTTAPGGYTGGPHAAADCCGREACVEDAKEWAQAATGGMEAVYVPDGER